MLARPMESQRRTPTPNKPTPPAVVRGLSPLAGGGFFARHGNTILTVALLLAAAVLAVRWWTRSAEAARAGIVQQLETARTSVDQLRRPTLLVRSQAEPVPLAPAEVVAKVRLLQTTAAGLLADVLNKSEVPAVKARALVVRGDLDWSMANLPELPGAATQPSLKIDPAGDEALRQAADSYTAALNTAGADAEAVAAAHMGLAAVAENKLDWPVAKQQLEAVADAANGVAVLSQAARVQLAGLPTLEKPLYLAPPAGVPMVRPAPAVMGPVLPTTVPMMPPTTRPVK